jgi:hypothetical protein
MTKNEKKQFCEAWLEAEDIITLIDPNFQPEKQVKRPEEAGPQEIKSLLQFLRIQVRLLLHDKEATERERNGFYKILQEHEAQSCG